MPECLVDCHTKCTTSLIRPCIEKGGQLPVAEQDDDTKLDEESTKIVEERRKSQKTNQVPFQKGGKDTTRVSFLFLFNKQNNNNK